MLDEYCNSLSDEAQLRIAIRLGREALPLWNNHFKKHPQDLNNVNALIKPENKVKGGQSKMDQDFLLRALDKIEQSYVKSKGSAWPVAGMKSDLLLHPYWVTLMQPLTNSGWDNALPKPVRLVYTSVWNILTWILYKRMNEHQETHIYISINQSCDALLSENILKTEQIEKILMEYQEMKRNTEEDTAWEMAPAANAKDETGAATGMDEIFNKIIGKQNVPDPPQNDQAAEILRQMKAEGKSFWDKWDEYYSGTSKTYSYNQEKKCFWYTEADVIAASFFNEFPMSEQEMYDFISGVSLGDLRENGFLI
jgi:hypothetical protein